MPTKRTTKTARAVPRRGPSPAKTAATRQAIMTAACELFLERGFSATRVSDVAERAGLAKGTAYSYFADKSAMIDAVLQNAIGHPLAGVRLEPVQEDESTKSFLRRVVLPIIRTIQEAGGTDLLRLVIRESATYPRVREIYRAMVLAPMSEFFRGLAARAAARNEVRSDGLQQYPMLLVAPVLVATVWNGFQEQEHENRISPADAFEAFLDLILV